MASSHGNPISVPKPRSAVRRLIVWLGIIFWALGSASAIETERCEQRHGSTSRIDPDPTRVVGKCLRPPGGRTILDRGRWRMSATFRQDTVGIDRHGLVRLGVSPLGP